MLIDPKKRYYVNDTDSSQLKKIIIDDHGHQLDAMVSKDNVKGFLYALHVLDTYLVLNHLVRCMMDNNNSRISAEPSGDYYWMHDPISYPSDPHDPFTPGALAGIMTIGGGYLTGIDNPSYWRMGPHAI